MDRHHITPEARTVFMTRKPRERAAILKAFRKQIGLSQDQLALNIRIVERTIQRAEHTGVALDDTWIALGHFFKQPRDFFQRAPIPAYAHTLDEQLQHPERIPKWDPTTHADTPPGQGHLARLNRYEGDLLEQATGAGWSVVMGGGGGDMIIARDTFPLLREADKFELDKKLLKRFAAIGML